MEEETDTETLPVAMSTWLWMGLCCGLDLCHLQCSRCIHCSATQSGALVVYSGILTVLLSTWIPLLLPLTDRNPTQLVRPNSGLFIHLFRYYNSAVSSWSLRTPWLLGSDTCKSSIQAVSLWYLRCLIMSHFRTGACLEGWLPDDFWLGASIIFSLCMSVHVLPLLLLLGI